MTYLNTKNFPKKINGNRYSFNPLIYLANHDVQSTYLAHMGEARSCVFCNGKVKRIYHLNGYSVIQCERCFTSTVALPPSNEELKTYYQRFDFQIDIKHLKQIQSPAILTWFRSHDLPDNATMLDVGGGAGFFAHAFEQFELGTSTYIDLDASACQFAQNTLGLKRVHNTDLHYLSNQEPESYDFIYCRHVIEHVIDPVRMIEDSIKLLKKNGTYVLQFPNALSLEYLGYPKRLKPFTQNIMRSNQLNFLSAARILLSKSNAFGLDPIRHLWAITPQAIEEYLKDRTNLMVTTQTASVSDPTFSPYAQTSGFIDKARAKIAKCCLAPIRGGAHAVVTIKKASTG